MGQQAIKNILITGGGGFVGLALCKRLIQKGYRVSSFSRKEYSEHKNLGVRGIVGSIENLKETIEACNNVDLVFHAASKVEMSGNFSDFQSVNVIGTQNIIDACIKNNVKYLIYVSTASVVFDSKDIKGANESLAYPKIYHSHYAQTKALAEQNIYKASKNDFKTIIIRPHLIWGLGDTQLIPKIIEKARTGKIFKIGKRKCKIDTIYIDNLIDSLILSMDHILKLKDENSRTYFVSNDQPIEIWEFINSILSVYNIKNIDKTIPKPLALFIFRLQVILSKIMKKPPLLNEFLIHQLTNHHWFDISEIKTDMNFNPRISIEEGFEKLKQYQDRNLKTG